MAAQQRPNCNNDARRQIKKHSRAARSGAIATVLTAHVPRETRAVGYDTRGVQFEKKKKSQNCFCQAAPIPKRDADALRARVATIRHVRLGAGSASNVALMAWRLTRRGVDSPSSILSRTQVAGAHRHLHGVIK